MERRSIRKGQVDDLVLLDDVTEGHSEAEQERPTAVHAEEHDAPEPATCHESAKTWRTAV